MMKYNKEFSVLGLVICCMFLVSFNGWTTDMKKENKEARPSFHAVGESKVVASVQKRMGELMETGNLVHKARAYFESGNYIDAKKTYLQCLAIMDKEKMIESYHQWLPRYGLAATYEKLGENQQAVDELNRLIKMCQSKKTTNELLARKHHLEKLLAENNSK